MATKSPSLWRPSPATRAFPWSSRLARAAALAALIALLAVQSAFSQIVRGVLLEEGTGQPIEGAFIVVLDEAGRQPGRVIGALTDAEGRFVLRIREPGRYRLRAERMGFKSTLTDVIELEADQTVDHVMVAPVEAVELESLVVTAEPVCDVRPDVGPRTAELWEEARKALSVVAWAEAEEYFRYRVTRHERELDPRSLSVREERTWERSVPVRGSLYVSRPAEDLAEGGYVRRAYADTLVYYAPDASVVLSESFADLHCFGVREGGGDQEGLIGLTFEPVPGRDLPDVEGVLWLDRKTAELRYLEYRYTRLPLPIWSRKIGGRVEFERLASGVWIVSRWWIRMPIVYQYEPLHPLDDRFRLGAIREEGGTVTEVRTMQGTLVRRGQGAALRGSVFDSARAAPLAGATVFLAGTDRAAETGELGRFEIAGLLEGEYSVSFSHPWLDSLQFTPEPVPVTLSRGRTTAVDLAVPTMSSILASMCPEGGAPEGTGAVVGLVRDARSTLPVAGATVRLSWSESDLRAAGERAVAIERRPVAETRTDGAGRYTVCGLPVGIAAALQATRDGRRSSEAQLRLARAEVVRRDLELSPSRVAEDRAPGPEPLITRERSGQGHPGVVLGRVVDEESGRPIDAVAVRLLGQETQLGRVTDGDGAFLIPDVPRSVYALVAEHLAYGTRRDTIEVGAAELVSLELRLALEPIELAPLVVTVRRRRVSAKMAGFYRRLDKGLGEFITREDIELRRPQRITHMIADLPSVRLVRVGLGTTAQRLIFRRYRRFSLTRAPCWPTVYLDGMIIQYGGQFSSARDYYLDNYVIPADVEAVEVYDGPAVLPPEFGGSYGGCGVIAVWTRSAP